MTRWIYVPLALVIAGCGDEPPASTLDTTTQPARPAATSSGSAPIIASARLRPDVVRGGEIVSIDLDVRDPDGDPIELTIEWYVNRQLYRQGDSQVLETDQLLKSSEIYAIVRASDGAETTTAQTSVVRLANSLPQITAVRMLPERPTAAETLIVEADVLDREGDSYQLSYEWLLNGEPLKGATDATLPPGRVKRGDSVSVRVTATDSEAGTPFVSQSVQVSNARPAITSKPATTLASATGYRYQIQAEDPDGDRPLRFSLVEGPDGMSVDLVSGLVEWEVPQDVNGTFPIELAVRDPYGGESRQSYSLEFRWESVPANAAEDSDADTESDEDAETESDDADSDDSDADDTDSDDEDAE